MAARFLFAALALGSIGCQPEEQPPTEREELSRFFEDHVLIGDVVQTALENANPPHNLGFVSIGLLSVSEAELTFDPSECGWREQTLTISNTGYGNLRIEDIALKQSDQRFRITETAPAGVLDAFSRGKQVYLAPGYDLSIDIELNRGESATTSTWLEIDSNDPSHPSKQILLVDKHEQQDQGSEDTGPIPAPAGELDAPARVILEPSSNTKIITLTNIGDGPIEIEDAELFGPHSITLLEPFEPVTLRPNEAMELALSYTPGQQDERAALLIETSAGTNEVRVLALEDDLDCDAFKISASSGGSDTLLDSPMRIEPRATLSLETSVTPDRYDRIEWDIVHKPVDSTTRFAPNSHTAEPRIFIDLEGDYTFLARIYRDGVQLCDDAEFDVIASAP